MAHPVGATATKKSVEYGYLYKEAPDDIRQLSRYFFPSKIGGKPAWLVPEFYPTPDDLQCSRCGRRMKFLLQIYASREDVCATAFHRMLYVFTCGSCTDQFRAFRCQLPLHNGYYLTENPNDYDSVSAVMDAYNAAGLTGSLAVAKRKGSGSFAREPTDLAFLSEYEIDAEAGSSSSEEISDDDEDEEVDLLNMLQDRRDKDLYREYLAANTETTPSTTDGAATIADMNSTAPESSLAASAFAATAHAEESNSGSGAGATLDASEMAYFEEWKRTHGADNDPTFRVFQKECLRRPRCILRVVVDDNEADDEGDDDTGSPASTRHDAVAQVSPSPGVGAAVGAVDSDGAAGAVVEGRLSLAATGTGCMVTGSSATSSATTLSFTPQTRRSSTCSSKSRQEEEREANLQQVFELQKGAGFHVVDQPTVPAVSKDAVGVDGKSPAERLKEPEVQLATAEKEEMKNAVGSSRAASKQAGTVNVSAFATPVKMKNPSSGSTTNDAVRGFTSSVEISSGVRQPASDSLILWYHEKDPANTRPDPKSVPRCRNCGSRRSFEFQVMPSMIGIAGTHHDFGTVLFYTCNANCYEGTSW
eukprot:g1459.t1